jgi:hypothetical protein
MLVAEPLLRWRAGSPFHPRGHERAANPPSSRLLHRNRLHSGNKVTLSLKPAPADYGIRFQRAISAVSRFRHRHAPGGIQYQTGLTREAVSVETVEHLLAALTALGIDNAIVELNTRKCRSWTAAPRRSCI